MSEAYCDVLKGRYGYPETKMWQPPSESNSNVIQFALTEGCSWNRCTFCDTHANVPYTVKSSRNFKRHVDSVLRHARTYNKLNRGFIGAGNALSVETNKLVDNMAYAENAVSDSTWNNFRFLSIYGNTNDILKQGAKGLQELSSYASLGVIYWGLESGNTKVLDIANKGYCLVGALKAAEILNKSKRIDINTSVMVMPGLGGIKNYDGHVKDTVEVLKVLKPRWITFMGLKINEGTLYADWMKKEEESGSNRRMEKREIIRQTADIIRGLDFRTNIGVFDSDVTSVCNNPYAIGSKRIYDQYDARDVSNVLLDKMNELPLEVGEIAQNEIERNKNMNFIKKMAKQMTPKNLEKQIKQIYELAKKF